MHYGLLEDGVGLTTPSEAITKAMTGILISCHCPDGAPEQWCVIVKELKTSFHSLKSEKVGVGPNDEVP